MGKKGWFSAVKKFLSPETREKKYQKSTQSSKKKWFKRHKSADAVSLSNEVADAVPIPLQPIDDRKFAEGENEQNKHAYSVALATAAAAEAAVAAAQAAAEVVRLTTISRYSDKSEEEIAAIKIQTAFRGYLARRALRALRGLIRLKSLIEGQSVKRQATTTLRCMQTLARVQSQIRSRRIRMSEENQALQRQLQQKHEKELEKLRMGEEWDDSMQSKEQIEANLQSKQDAAMRRERTLAYAFSHQQMRKSSRSANPTFMDPTNPQWGWSWLERWMAARPWEARIMAHKEFNDHSSVKSGMSRSLSVTRETNNAYALRDLELDNKPSPTTRRSSRPPSRQSPSTPSRALPSSTPTVGKTKHGNGGGTDDDSKSTMSIQSEKYRRHSIPGSSLRDDESLSSSPSVPSYMAPTHSQSAKAKTRLPSPMEIEEKSGTPEKGSAGSVKKRLSFPASPTVPRGHSVPSKIEGSSINGVAVHPEERAISNGGISCSVPFPLSHTFWCAVGMRDMDVSVGENLKMVNLQAIEATPENFQEFGQVIEPLPDSVKFGPHDAQLDLSHGTPRFYIMHLEDRPLKFSTITHHASVTQCLGSSGGHIWYLGVAKPSVVDPVEKIVNTSKTISRSPCGHFYVRPNVEDVRVFKVMGPKFLKLNRGTWHAGPMFEADAMDFYNLELTNTNVIDHTTHSFKEDGLVFSIDK
ncbi:hypothetical protein Nepgr_001217 [Nepenthes gracilis]|uniref:DUF4005 domain-containing protein n=1 Tax=Nepenthes gracilis TaxID=150966 RepID=A0AAD3P6P9_NEPGR|nr:hypothetical protein Nepgr_001217 [Nepenthes gracilis]